MANYFVRTWSPFYPFSHRRFVDWPLERWATHHRHAVCSHFVVGYVACSGCRFTTTHLRYFWHFWRLALSQKLPCTQFKNSDSCIFGRRIHWLVNSLCHIRCCYQVRYRIHWHWVLPQYVDSHKLWHATSRGIPQKRNFLGRALRLYEFYLACGRTTISNICVATKTA